MPRTLLIFAVCLPLAVLMGFMLSDPLARNSLLVVSLTFTVLLMPLMLSFHHIAVVWSATAYINVFFLPGQPKLWMLCAGISLGISVLSMTLSKQKQKFPWSRSVCASLIFLFLVVFITAQFTGGIGTTAMGSDVIGGKKYFWLFGGIIGFFAIIMHPIPMEKVQKYMAGYCLSSLTAAFSNIAYILGPAFYFLFLLFPVDLAISQASADYAPGGGMVRLGGLAPAAVGIATFVAARWGITGLFDIARPYRLLLFTAAILCALLSGFRSIFAFIFIVYALLAVVEKVYKTKLGVGLAIGCGLALMLILAFSEHLPLAAQRSISFLPVKVDPMARVDARASLDWRFEMWSVLWDQVPQYLWRGKGYAINPTDMYFANEALARGFARNYEAAIIATDYHSGPFSVLIPFGIFGVIAVVWFLGASLIALYKNYRYSPPELQLVNNFLFAFFMAKSIFFVFLFGALEVDLWTFASAIGLSIAINNGVREKPQKPALKIDVAARRGRARELEMAGV